MARFETPEILDLAAVSMSKMSFVFYILGLTATVVIGLAIVAICIDTLIEVWNRKQ
jgi:hypothetical protein